MFNANTIPIRSKDVLVRPDGAGFLLFHARTDEMHHVSREAHEVLKLCDGARTVAEIVELFVGEAPEQSRPARREPIERLVKDLATREVVELWR